MQDTARAARGSKVAFVIVLGLLLVLGSSPSHAACRLRFALAWGSKGLCDGCFGTVADVAAAPNGDIHVLDFDGCRVQRFTANGVFLSSFGHPGSGPGAFEEPHTLLYDHRTDHILVSDRTRIQVFDADGTFVTSHPVDDAATAVEVDPSGGYFTLGYHTSIVRRVDSNFRVLASWGSEGAGPGQFRSPTRLCVLEDTTVVVVDHYNHRLQRFSPGGDLLRVWGTEGSGPGEFRFPMDAAVWGGLLCVTDFDNHRIQVFDLDGTYLCALGDSLHAQRQLANPRSLVASEFGLYADDFGRTEILHFSPREAPPTRWRWTERWLNTGLAPAPGPRLER